MTKKEAIKIFEEKKVRTVWDDDQEKWYFSIVDIVCILTDSVDGRKYWNKLKQRLKAEGNETVTNCHGLKMKLNENMGDNFLLFVPTVCNCVSSIDNLEKLNTTQINTETEVVI